MIRSRRLLSSLMKIAASAVLTAGLSVAGLGSSLPSKVAEAASPVCGSGDHGLLGDLQKKHKGPDQMPLHFTDINFLSDWVGRAAGNGFLVGTSDGGCHWQEIYKGSWQFAQIHFPDNVKGWALAAASDNGPNYLIGTSDGGAHWKRIDSTPELFTNLKTVNGALYGFTSNRIYQSTDGARSWKKVNTPPNTRAGSFNDASGKTGYVLTVVPGGGYKVMKTTNSGSSWRTVLTIPSESVIGGELYSRAGQVWALVYGESGMSQVSYSLYASPDSGGSWKRVIGQDTAGGGPAPGSGKVLAAKGPASPGGHPGNMALIGSSTAYLAGGSPAGGVVGVGRSYNGGRSWTNVPAVIKGYDARISFPSQKTGWLTVTSATETAVYVTHDGGVSWNQKFKIPDAVS
ncbi:hypothetical protein [Paenibacillus physcomitrellae]|uniref:Photosynthesis system II assembly factor Ycf48/Hcf136-like domain-containing protein n=1 Tax=Paenibacillus physcomitrellae TaxID=1619311 RepID=A0ABQ1GZR9_9BACL|nr:hypothetical protein [Paenibacillus physcomitrellae]GGA52960.1 hypothetical protein GCM10010917_42730 [Paenibacillus physcomitrellae]